MANDHETQRVVGYARVPSDAMTDALASQVARLEQSDCRPDECVTEVGSVFADSRPKLLALLADASVETIVVDYQDRLTHFGFEYIQAALEGRGAKIIVLEDGAAPRERMPLTVSNVKAGGLDQGNAGLPWDAEDYQVLVERIRAGDDADEIAVALYRKPGGVSSRLKWLLPPDESEGMRSLDVLTELRGLLATPDYDWKGAVLENYAVRIEHVPAPDFTGPKEDKR